MDATRVGVIGSGQVGRALAEGFASRGHDVRLGTRDPKKEDLKAWSEGSGVGLGTFADVAEYGELLVLATLGAANEEALALAGPEHLAGKVLIDATNPLEFHDDGPPGLFVGHTDSGGEQVQRAAPEARVVKAFNIVGNPYFVDPDLPGGPPDMFIAGNDEDAKAAVTDVLEDFGWPVTDIGGIEGARVLEPLCLLWVYAGIPPRLVRPRVQAAAWLIPSHPRAGSTRSSASRCCTTASSTWSARARSPRTRTCSTSTSAARPP